MKESAKTDALLEIGTEEIPASYLPPALAHLKTFSENFLAEKKLPFQSVATYGTPRRMTLHLIGVAPKSEAVLEEIWGPSLKAAKDAADQWNQAAKGFAQSQGVSLSELQVKPTKKGEYLCVVKKHAGLKAEKVLAELFEQVAPSIPFPKKMVWNATLFRFARPIRNVVALYGHQVLKVSIAGVKAANKTFSLSHLSAKKITISSPQSYVTTLKNQCVLVNPDERRQTILNGASQLAQRVHGHLKADDALLEEVVWLVEHPVVVMGGFDAQFLGLPQEVLTTCMKKHQKFFSVLDARGKLLPHFIAIRNGISEHQDTVRKGYEKVLNARLTDAKFFFEVDLKRPLDAYLKKCSGIMLQDKLGSMSDKIGRMTKIGGFVARALGSSHASGATNGKPDMAVIERAIHLSKFDLATNIVYEFPELQGTVGGIYAAYYGENHKVSSAIREHYFPVTVQGDLPTTADSAVVSVADKMDGLAGSFIIGRVPSGSSDPYGLRRQSTGILRIFLENQWSLSLKELADFSVGLFQADNKDALSRDILAFMAERFQLLMQDVGFEPDEIQAVVKNHSQADARELRPVALKQKISALHQVRRHPDFEAVAGAYKRASNILKQARAKQVPHAPGDFRSELLRADEEKALHQSLEQAAISSRALMRERKYEEALLEWVRLRKTSDAFFDKVMVMDPDPALATNRLSLLAALEALFKELAEFGHLQSRAAQV